MSNKNSDNTANSILFYLIYSRRDRTMNDFLYKSVSYSSNQKGWPRKCRSRIRYGGSRW